MQSAIAGPSSRTIEYYTALETPKKPHRRRKKKHQCTCTALAGLTLVNATFAQEAPQPTAESLHKRMIPYYEYVDGKWQVSDDWRLYGVRGKERNSDEDTTRNTLPAASQDLAQEDASLESTGLSSIQATMTSSYSLSATPTSSVSATSAATAASFSAPAGWANNRERSIFYTVPLIIVASVLLFFSIFGIIGGVTIKRSRKKQLAKQAKAADVESAEGKDSSDFGGRPKFVSAAKRKLKKTKARIVKGARRKPLVLVVPSEMISSTRLTASALELRQAGLVDSSSVLRQRTSLARQSTRQSTRSVGTATPVEREEGSEAEEEQEGEALSPSNSRTALTNEDAQSSREVVIPRRRSLFSTLSGSGSPSSSRRNSTVASPPAYRPANRSTATPSYAAATGSTSPPVNTRTARQTEKMPMQSTEEMPEQPESHEEEQAEGEEPVDRSLYVGHVATDDKAFLQQIHTLASAPENTTQADDGSAPVLPIDEEGFEDHSHWLEQDLPPPSSSALPSPSAPIDTSYTGHQGVASAPPMLSPEEEASAPPLWEEEENGRRDHVEV